jgi:hypothetical protein
MSEAQWLAAASALAQSATPKSIRIGDPRMQDTTVSNRWKFKYDADAQTSHGWETNMTCLRCVHVDLNTGRRCRRNTCITLPVCWQHLKSDYKLRIGRTTLRDQQGRRLHFLGLFACDDSQPSNATVFDIGDAIVPYVGEVINAATLESRYPGEEVAPYVDKIHRNKFVDAGPMRGVGSIANMCEPSLAFKPDGVTPMCTNNVFMNTRGIGQHSFPFLEAARPIKNGDEIFNDYDTAYFGEGSIHLKHETRPTTAYAKTEYKCRLPRASHS